MAEADPAATWGDRDRAAVGNSGAPELRLGAYEGPLDLLLELARAQKVDLAKISIATMADQFSAVVETEITRGSASLSRLGDWLVMATWLTLLRARLLVPRDPADAAAAEREAADLRRRLSDRLFAQRLATWLERRQQLGRNFFARGRVEPALVPEPPVDVTELLRACLLLLRLPSQAAVWAPAPPIFWRFPDALRHVRTMLRSDSRASLLSELVPSGAVTGRMPRQRAAAVASVFLAGLELAREGSAILAQESALAEVVVSVATARPEP